VTVTVPGAHPHPFTSSQCRSALTLAGGLENDVASPSASETEAFAFVPAVTSKSPVKSVNQCPVPSAVTEWNAPPGGAGGGALTLTFTVDPAGAVPATSSVVGSTVSMVRATRVSSLVVAPWTAWTTMPGARSWPWVERSRKKHPFGSVVAGPVNSSEPRAEDLIVTVSEELAFQLQPFTLSKVRSAFTTSPAACAAGIEPRNTATRRAPNGRTLRRRRDQHGAVVLIGTSSRSTHRRA
jgi:hypothetical protein